MLHKLSIREKLLQGGLWSFSGKIVAGVSGLAVHALLARLLAPEELGAYVLTFSFVTFAATIAQLGMSQVIIRLVAESMGTNRYGRARQSVTLALRISAFGGFIVACALAFGGGDWIADQLFHSELMSNVTGLVVAWMVVMTFQQLMAETFRGFHDVRLATIFGGLVTSVLSMVIFLALWWLQGNGELSQIILLTLVAGGSSAMLSSFFLWKKLSVLPLPVRPQINISEVLSISWPLWVTSLIIFVLSQVGLWIMGMYSSQEEVAIYGSASRMVALVVMPLLIVNSVVPPLIPEMYSQGKTKELERMLRIVSTLSGLPSLIVLGVLVFFSDTILGLFFGEYYQAGGKIMTILCIGQLANVWAGSCGLVLMLTGNQNTMMIITICCGVLTAIFAWLLVSMYGGVGVAIAAASGMTLQNLLMLLFTKKNIGIWTHMSPLLIRKYWRIVR